MSSAAASQKKNAEKEEGMKGGTKEIGEADAGGKTKSGASVDDAVVDDGGGSKDDTAIESDAKKDDTAKGVDEKADGDDKAIDEGRAKDDGAKDDGRAKKGFGGGKDGDEASSSVKGTRTDPIQGHQATATAPPQHQQQQQHQPTYSFWAVKKCSGLKGPAIFSNFKDCEVFLKVAEMCDKDKDDAVEYRGFRTIWEASQYLTGTPPPTWAPILPSPFASQYYYGQQPPNPTAARRQPPNWPYAGPPPPGYFSPTMMPPPYVAAAVATAAAAAAAARQANMTAKDSDMVAVETGVAAAAAIVNGQVPILPRPLGGAAVVTGAPPGATTNASQQVATNSNTREDSSDKDSGDNNNNKNKDNNNNNNKASKKSLLPNQGPPWEERFEQLLRYKEKHGTTNVLKCHCNTEEFNLSFFRWYVRQRKMMSRLESEENEKDSGETAEDDNNNEEEGKEDSQDTNDKDDEENDDGGNEKAGDGNEKDQATDDNNGKNSDKEDGDDNGKETEADADGNNGSGKKKGKKVHYKIAKKVIKDRENYEKLKSIGVLPHVPTAPQGSKDWSAERVEKWEKLFDELKQFAADNNGSLKVPHIPENKVLYRWIEYQQKSLRDYLKDPSKSTLNQDRVDRLLALGLQPTGEASQINPENRVKGKGAPSWDEMYEKLKLFHATHGHVEVPDKNNAKLEHWSKLLRNWVLKCRDDYDALQKGEESDLTPQRMQLLGKLEFRFQTNRRMTFDHRAAEWLEYYTKHGKDPPLDEGSTLAIWCAKVRRKYRTIQDGGHAALTQPQIDKLKSWGFSFERKVIFTKPPAARKPWAERFQQLIEYKEKNGHVNVPQTYPELGMWVHHQRKYYRKWKEGKKSTFTQEKYEMMEGIGFTWLTRKRPRRTSSSDGGTQQPSTNANNGSDPKKRPVVVDDSGEDDDDDGDDEGSEEEVYELPELSVARRSPRMQQSEGVYRQQQQQQQPQYHPQSPWKRFRTR